MPYRSRSTLTLSLFISSRSRTSGYLLVAAEQVPVAGSMLRGCQRLAGIRRSSSPPPVHARTNLFRIAFRTATKESLLSSPFQASFQSSVATVAAGRPELDRIAGRL